MLKQPECLVLSLEETTLRKIAVNLWTDTDVLALIGNFPLEMNPFELKEIWKKRIEKKVKDKILELIIPAKLKKRMSPIVRLIGLQIVEWKGFIEKCLYDSRENLHINILIHLCWTPAGAIHYEKTAETLATLNMLDVVQRFKIASEHCLVDFLPVVWKEFPENCKREFLELLSYPNRTNIFDKYQHPLQVYWIFVLQGEEYKLLESDVDVYLHGLESSAKFGNKAAAKYFFQKLSEEEQEFFFEDIDTIIREMFSKGQMYGVFPKTNPSDVLCFLLSLISPERQKQVFTRHPGYLLEAFLTWRWHDFFLDSTDLFWNSQPETQGYYDSILRHMRKIVDLSAYYFPELFQEFICRSPKDFRIYLVDVECLSQNYSLFSKLLYRRDKDTLKEILNNLDAKDKVRLVSGLYVFQSFNFLLDGKQRHIVEFCVLEACSSKEDREKLRETFERTAKSLRKQEGCFTRWERFFESLDKIDSSIPKDGGSDIKTDTGDIKLPCKTEEVRKMQ